MTKGDLQVTLSKGRLGGQAEEDAVLATDGVVRRELLRTARLADRCTYPFVRNCLCTIELQW